MHFSSIMIFTIFHGSNTVQEQYLAHLETYNTSQVKDLKFIE